MLLEENDNKFTPHEESDNKFIPLKKDDTRNMELKNFFWLVPTKVI